MARQVHDPTVLRAVAHPLRNRILGELTARGSMRAADLARELDVPANSASFHLRQLAKYGLVEEDPDAARDKRDRVWKVTAADGLTFDLSELAEAPGGAAAADVFRRNAASWGHAVVEAAYGSDRDDGAHRTVTDQALRLTPEEARALGADLAEVAEAWLRRTRDDPGGDAERRTYVLFSVVAPYPGIAGPAEDAD